MKINKKTLIRFFTVLIFLTVLVLPSFSSALTINVVIPEKYSEIQAGEKVYFETDIKWPENVGRKDLSIEYSVIDKNDNEVAYIKVLKAIETQASFMDSISIPESTPPGMYKISTKFSDYKDLNQEVSASFNVAQNSNKVLNYLFIIIGILGIIVSFMIVEMFLLIKRKN